MSSSATLTAASSLASGAWGPVLAAAARAGVRALVVGCGGHVLFRAVVYHLVPLLLRHLRRHRRRARPQLTQQLTPHRALQADEEAKEEEGKEETDGPVVTPRRAGVNEDEGGKESAMACDDGNRCGSRLAWLWDGAQNRESLRLGIFLSSMTGGFRVVEYALQRLRGVDDGWNSFLAGTVAGLSIAIDTKSRQKAVSLYVFFKACGMVWSSLTTRGLLPRGGGRWTLAQHGIWCLLCGVMMYCFFCEGELLDSFVYRFLYSCTSPHDQYAMSYVRKHALGLTGEDPEAKAQERRDYASGKLRAVPPPVVVKRREHFALMRRSAAAGPCRTGARPGERVE